MHRNKLYVYGDDTLTVPSHLHFGKYMLQRMIAYGDHPAIINADDGKTMTFGELAQQTVDIALSLARIGVGKGDVVTVCSEKRMEIMPTILGVFCVGGVYTPSDCTSGAAPLLHRLKMAKPKIAFMSPNAYDVHKPIFDTAGWVEKYIVYGDENKDGGISFKEFLTESGDVRNFVPTPVDGWKDLTLILFSSGTTGLPKGVPWTHLGILINSDSCTNESFKCSSILITREWFLTYGLFLTLSCLKRGTTCVFSIRNEEEDYLRAIEKYKIKIIQTAPNAINQMIKSAILDQYDVTSVENIVSSSMPIMKEQVEAVKKRLPNLRGVYQIYGNSEAGNACNELHAPLGPKDGSVGTPSHGFVIKVVDFNTGEALGPHQRGEICFKSPTLTPGYLGVGTSDHLDCDGFFKTGDVGYYDEDNYFYVVNRLKELIKYKDYSVAPAELEAVLCSEGRVREAGVTSLGGAPTALVILQPDAEASAQELEDYLHSMIPSRMRLEGGVHFGESLPRGAGDKLDRTALHLMLESIVVNKKLT